MDAAAEYGIWDAVNWWYRHLAEFTLEWELPNLSEEEQNEIFPLLKPVIEGKVDPSFDMNQFRKDVAERLKHAASWSPGGTTTTPSTSGDLDMDAKAISNAVWDRDEIPAPPSASTFKTNPTWKASSYFKEIYERQLDILEQLGALAKKVDAIEKKVG